MVQRSRRRSFEAASRAAVLALALVMAGGSAHAAVTLEAGKRHETTVTDTQAVTVVAEVPFHLSRPGGFYAKLLVTPFNAVNPGQPNGTLAPDGSGGATGWWVSFLLADGNGAPVTADANGAAIDPQLGYRVDSTPTRLIALPGGVPFRLLVGIQVPSAALVDGAQHRVPVALVFRDLDAGDATASGGTLDQSRAFTETLVIQGGTGAVNVGPSGDGSGAPTGNATTGAQPAEHSSVGGSAPQETTAARPSVSVGDLFGGVSASLLIWLFVLLLLIALTLLAVAVALLVLVIMLYRRETAATRPNRAPDAALAPAAAAPPTRPARDAPDAEARD